jgi:hypothetical protein
MDPQNIIPRMMSIEYDGTNSAQILALINQEMGTTGPDAFTIISESGGELVIREPFAVLGGATVTAGDFVVITPGQFVTGCPAAVYVARYATI